MPAENVVSFSSSTATSKPTFGDVADEQFFVCEDGTLCQKINDEKACMIATKNGTPYCDTFEYDDSSQEITRILPKVDRIEF